MQHRFSSSTLALLLAFFPIIVAADPVPVPGSTWVQATGNEWQLLPGGQGGVVNFTGGTGGGIAGNAGTGIAGIGTANAMCAGYNPATEGVRFCVQMTPLPVGGFCTPAQTCQATWYTSLLSGVVNQVGMGLLNNALRGALGGGTPTTGQRIPVTSGGGSTTGCRQYTRTSVRTNDPCAIYVPATSTSQTSREYIDQVLRSIRTAPSGGIQTYTPPKQQPQTLGQKIEAVSDSLFNWNQTKIPLTTPKAPEQTPNYTSSVQEGGRSDLRVSATGITLEAGFRNFSANTDTSAFFGASVKAPTPAERLCLVRPWQNSIISPYIPATLFDDACAKRGYRAGIVAAAAPAAKPAVSTQPVSATKPGATAKATSTVPYVAPSIDIWAVPSSVSIGSRTSIYWYSKGVESCTVSSPDGSFRQNALANLYGASTVPLTGATIFSLSCLAPDGSPVTDFVKVGVGI